MKIKRLLALTIVIIATIIINATMVFADPNSSKGYATFTEEDANNQVNEQVQENQNLVTEVKSSDNYLENLKVEGYTLTPDFDKQTLEYSIKEEITTNEIKIEAKSSNEKAQISGIGLVKIENNKNEYRVDVTAESGAVRTYIIKVNNKNTEKKEVISETSKEINNLEENKKEVINKTDTEDNSFSKNIIIYSVIIAGVILLLIILKKASNKKHKKYKRKH